MKTTLVIPVLLAGLASASLALGADGASSTGKKKAPAKAKSECASSVLEQNVQLTGSLIRRDIRRSGRITDSASPVVVIDRATIERSGAGDLGRLLTQQAVRR